jgi:rod shape-determining protein MreD
MSRYLLWLCGFAIVIFQTTVFNWFIPSSWHEINYHISPHFTLIYVIMMGFFKNRYFALWFGASLGMIIDIIGYGNMLGIYAFGLALVGYLVGLIRVYTSDSFLLHIHIALSGILFFEIINYTSNRIFKIINYSFVDAFLNFIVPTILFHIIVVIVLYIPYKKLIVKLS